MAKRKIAITVDEELVEWLRAEDAAVSAVENSALRDVHDRQMRREALAAMLQECRAGGRLR